MCVRMSYAMSPIERDTSITVRMTDEERTMLHALASEIGVSISDVVRMQIREGYRAKFGDKKPTKPKKK